MMEFAKKVIHKTYESINSSYFYDNYRCKPTSFTRDRKMGFKDIISMCLNFVKKSLQLELDNYMELTDPTIEKPITKQAFSKARQNISPEAFNHLYLETSKMVLEEDEIRRYNGYRIFAIDGTELQIPNSMQTEKEFTQPRGKSFPRARVSMLCDVIGGFVVHANINDLTVDERTLALEHLEYFKPYKQNNDIVIFDRGYPSKNFIKYLNDNDISYLIRLHKSFSPQIDTDSRQDFFFNIEECKTRVIKVPLDNGEIETLITNLSRTAFSYSKFKDLYNLRWGIETKYNTLKNKLEVETFSGKTIIAIKQDFFATMYLSNIVSVIKAGTDDMISERIKDRNLKYEYKTNENLLIGKLRNKFILIILNEDPASREILLDRLVNQIASNKVPIVPGRSFPRPSTSHKKITAKPKKAL
ncbi:MAG: transposase [Bacillota bacterium]